MSSLNIHLDHGFYMIRNYFADTSMLNIVLKYLELKHQT